MKKTTPRALALLLCFTGCGDSGGPSTDGGGDMIDGGPQIDSSTPGEEVKHCEDKSGTRLKLRYYELPGGMVHPFGPLYDSELETPCNPGHFADDVWRCYPSDFGGTIFYLDSNCTQPIIAFSPGIYRPYHRVLTPTVDSCGNNASYRVVDPQLLVDPTNLWQPDMSDICQVAAVQDLDYYSVGQPLALSNFESLSLSERPLGTRLGTQTMEGTDGSVVCRDNIAYDRDREEWCRSRVDNTGVSRCIPDSSNSIESHTLDNCVDPAVDVAVIDNVCEVSAPTYVRETVDMECGKGIQLKTVGDAVTPFSDPGTGCVAIADGRSYFAITENVSPDQFVELSERIEDSGNRLQQMFLAADDDYGLATGWYDRRFEAPCVFEEAEDGVTRCLPVATGVSEFFSDETCAEPFDGAVIDGCTGEVKFLSKPGKIGGTRILAAGAAVEGAVRRNPGCTLVEESVAPADYEIAPSSFVEVEEVIEQ